MAAHGFHRDGVDVFVPRGGDAVAALRGVTHLGIGAHADDLEFMAFHGIETCRRGGGQFGGVVVTDGAGSLREDGLNAEEFVVRRREEQREAALLGDYSVVVQLGLGSAEVRTGARSTLEADLAAIFALASPEVVYTHNPADRHDTHVAVCLGVIRALRALPQARRPRKVHGCEVWRDLDWLTGGDRVRLDCGDDEAFAARLNGVFRSQIAGGKRYDLAVIGRRRAQATFDDPRTVDEAAMLTLAMDLTPLVDDAQLTVAEFVARQIDRFRRDVVGRLRSLG